MAHQKAVGKAEEATLEVGSTVDCGQDGRVGAVGVAELGKFI